MKSNISDSSRTKMIHLVCIGGSGLRVLRSFVMLLSAGYDIPGYSIKPYIVDPHLQSKDLKFATDLLAQYNKLYCKDNKGFFKVPLSIDNIDNLNVMKVENTLSKSFGDFVGYRKVESTEKNVIEMLYSKLNIEKSMNVGFKGSPNVGSVVFQEFTNGDWFQHNFANLTSNDKVILVGSLFGGTGASGVPAIAKALKSMNSNIEIAAIVLTPYFKLKKPSASALDKDIDSDIFDMKSLAALNFYKEKNPGVDSFYVVGDTISKEYDYDELNQGNAAHFIELVAATAVNHFALVDKAKYNQWNMFFTDNLSNTMLYDDCRSCMKDVLECLANFYAFSKFFYLMKKETCYPFNRRFYEKIKIESNFADQFEVLEEMIFNRNQEEDSYIRWMGELRDNTRAFNAVNTADIKSNSTGYSFEPTTANPVYNGTERLSHITMSDYFLAVNNAYRRSLRTTNQISPVSNFLNWACEGISEVNSR